MRRSVAFSALVSCLTLAIGTLASASHAAEFKSGPQVGDMVGAFQVTKAAGATDDGVAVGEELCYRCRMGNRPMVMVFARTPDAALAGLVKQLDKTVADNNEKKMGSFVSLLGDKPAELTKQAEEAENGSERFR